MSTHFHSTAAMQTNNVYMQEALRVAKQGWYTTRPNPAVGCVLVKDKKIIARGWHQYPGGPHAEQMALSQVSAEQAKGAACYVTLEPCAHHGKTPPCIDALIQAQIGSLHIATSDPNALTSGKGIAAARAHGIEVEVGLHAPQAIDLNPGFFSHHIRKAPWVRAKIAITLDGRTAKANGSSQWITGPLARKRVQHWRALSGAIVTGIGTVLADDPQLTVRDQGIVETEHFSRPAKFIMDRQQRLPATAKILEQGPVVHCHLDKQSHSLSSGAQSLILQSDNDWQSVWQYCYEQEMQSVLIEAGPTLLGSLLDLGMIDELIVHIAPKFLGQTAKPFAKLKQALPLNEPGVYSLVESLPLGDDIELRYQHQESQKCLMV